MTITDRLKKPGLKKGAALLPSLFTIGNLFLGFSAIIYSLRLEFETAALYRDRLAALSAIQSQQGTPSAVFAAIFWKIGFTSGHASWFPPGMIAGPHSAPSSPPLTPVPI